LQDGHINSVNNSWQYGHINTNSLQYGHINSANNSLQDGHNNEPPAVKAVGHAPELANLANLEPRPGASATMGWGVAVTVMSRTW